MCNGRFISVQIYSHRYVIASIGSLSIVKRVRTRHFNQIQPKSHQIPPKYRRIPTTTPPKAAPIPPSHSPPPPVIPPHASRHSRTHHVIPARITSFPPPPSFPRTREPRERQPLPPSGPGWPRGREVNGCFYGPGFPRPRETGGTREPREKQKPLPRKRPGWPTGREVNGCFYGPGFPQSHVIPADAGTQRKTKHAATAEADRGGQGARGKRLFLWPWVPRPAGMTGAGGNDRGPREPREKQSTPLTSFPRTREPREKQSTPLRRSRTRHSRRRGNARGKTKHAATAKRTGVAEGRGVNGCFYGPGFPRPRE